MAKAITGKNLKMSPIAPARKIIRQFRNEISIRMAKNLAKQEMKALTKISKRR